jgi:hypothetical protein
VCLVNAVKIFWILCYNSYVCSVVAVSVAVLLNDTWSCGIIFVNMCLYIR